MNQYYTIESRFTGNSDLTWRITSGEAVFGKVIHIIFHVWHYGVLWTYELTRVVWYACDFVHSILFITQHTTYFTACCQMNFIECSHVHSQVYSYFHSIEHSQPAWLYYPECSQWYTPSLHNLRCEVSFQDTPKFGLSMLLSIPLSMFSSTLPGMLSRMLPNAPGDPLPACLTLCTHVSLQDALNHIPKYSLKYTPNCMW